MMHALNLKGFILYVMLDMTLVNDFNPKWNDLSEEIGVTIEMIEAVKAHYSRHSDTESSSAFQNPIQHEGIAGQARNDGRLKGGEE